MNQITQIIEFINQYEILLFLIYLLGSFIAASIIDKIFISFLKKIVEKTKTRFSFSTFLVQTSQNFHQTIMEITICDVRFEFLEITKV